MLRTKYVGRRYFVWERIDYPEYEICIMVLKSRSVVLVELIHTLYTLRYISYAGSYRTPLDGTITVMLSLTFCAHISNLDGGCIVSLGM
jgi:hypothetical protein